MEVPEDVELVKIIWSLSDLERDMFPVHSARPRDSPSPVNTCWSTAFVYKYLRSHSIIS